MCDHCGCRDFPPIAELSADHETILELAWTLAEEPRAGRIPDPGVKTQLLELLDRHVAKEETGLYPVLLGVGGVSADEVTRLEAEHTDLHQQLSGEIFTRLDFYALAAHIETEETELFPFAMLRFDEKEWDVTSDVHRAVDAGRIAAGIDGVGASGGA